VILFIASNPSHLNEDPKKPFIGSRSEKKFNEWASRLAPNGYKAINVIDTTTEGNRALKKVEIEDSIIELCEKIKLNENKKIIALGKTAQLAIELAKPILGEIDYFALPHPSPLNRFLNNRDQVEAILEECERWIKNK